MQVELQQAPVSNRHMTDDFDRQRNTVDGLPNTDKVAAKTIVCTDLYGKVEHWTIESFRQEGQDWVFVVCADGEKHCRQVRPPSVMSLILRQHESVLKKGARRRGREAASQRDANPFANLTAAQRKAMTKKAVATRKAKAEKRRLRKSRKS